MSTLPELTVEEYTSKSDRQCEFEPACDGKIAYMITPPTCDSFINSTVHPDDEFTSFVCREHLGVLVALRLAGKYAS